MRLPIAATLLVLAVPVAHAQQVVRAEAETRTVDCAGADAQVEGNRNTLTFTNSCRSLRLRGEANIVAIELAPGARIDVEGNGNRVRYGLPGGAAPPAVRVSGSNTDLAPEGGAAAAARPQTVTLTGDDQKLEVDCAGRAVGIQGNRSRYTLRGGCQSVSVHGDGNTVAAELRPDATVEIEGNGTSLSYRTGGVGEPQVTVRGNNSRAVREGARAASAAPAVATAPQPPATPASPQTATSQAPPTPAVSTPETAQAAPSLPQLMHDLDARVVADGTLVSLPRDAMFGADADQLRPDATPRLTLLAQLAARIHPSGVRVSACASDAALAERQSRAVGAWLTASGQVRPPIRTQAAAGPAQLDVLLLR